jgi:hypothetical protein
MPESFSASLKLAPYNDNDAMIRNIVKLKSDGI